MRESVHPEPEVVAANEVPNTGPDKVPGVFEKFDLVRLVGMWAKESFVVEPADEDGIVKIIATCGCGGVQSHPVDHLMHEYFYLHPNEAPAE